MTNSGQQLSLTGRKDYGRARRHRSSPPFTSTYRLQFSPAFKFEDAAHIVTYLQRLGIEAVYASPIFEARLGSSHGYDVTDQCSVRSELGGETSLRRLIRSLHGSRIGWLQDIVPNHMAFDPSNGILSDILIYGKRSAYRRFFDINWSHRNVELHEKLLAPFLSRNAEDIVREGQLRIFVSGKLMIDMSGFCLPASDRTYAFLLDRLGSKGNRAAPKNDSGKSSGIRLFSSLYRDKSGRESIDELLGSINRDPALLSEILGMQNFVPREWKSTADEINYRRFFAVNDMIGIRAEDSRNFSISHNLIERFSCDGTFDGIRVDHIDGLFDPTQYIRRLRRRASGCYLIVEKILTDNETLPQHWKVDGTTGYDFLSWVDRLQIKERGLHSLREFFKSFTGISSDCINLAAVKLETVRRLFRGDISNISDIFLSALPGTGSPFFPSISEMEGAITEMLSRLPLYRTYLSPGQVSNVFASERTKLKSALTAAMHERPSLRPAFMAINAVIEGAETDRGCMRAIMRLQQLMPAVFAKSVEDTLFFRYLPLMSLCEVGNHPLSSELSVAEFQMRIINRFKTHPYSMNATSTHDTKLGEDARARLNVLTEVPRRWQLLVRRWSRVNRTFRSGRGVPDRFTEYLIYQILAATFPFPPALHSEYTERIGNYLRKALREGGLLTSWEDPDTDYENASVSFMERVIEPSNTAFRDSFDRFVSFLSFHGMLNSLSAVTLKITCPGIPDIYQGSESWNFSLVDPDNRRPVDYAELTKRMEVYCSGERQERFFTSLANLSDGYAKFYVTCRLLNLRKQFRDLFLSGEYVPLDVSGRSEKLVSFCRRSGRQWAIVSVPRHTVGIARNGLRSIWGEAWKGTGIYLPPGAPSRFREVIGPGREVTAAGSGRPYLPVYSLLRGIPVSVLLSDDQEVKG